MTNRIVPLLSFLASLTFFLVALLRAEARAVYIALGVIFVMIAGGAIKKKKNRG